MVEDAALMVLISTSRSGHYPHIPPCFLVGHCSFPTITCTAHWDRCNICHRRQWITFPCTKCCLPWISIQWRASQTASIRDGSGRDSSDDQTL